MKSFIYYLTFQILSHFIFSQQNTILIIADDVSPDYFGAFSNTTDTANVPNITGLAQRSVRFSKVWASPVCSPTRAGIFSGRYSFRTGVGQVITAGTSPQLDTAEMSIAKLLKWHAPKKYNTACVGKWHLHNNQLNKRPFPNNMGYDLYSGNFNGALSNYYNWIRVKNGIQDTLTTYATTQTIDDAIAWLDTVNTVKPFFLWIAFNAPHTPYHIPPANLCNTVGLTGTPQHITANPKLYFKAALEAMDTEIGRLFQYLTANNKMDSTNIIFMGDNGNDGKVAQITNTLNVKGTIYDYGVRVPFMVAGPAVVNPNRTSNELVNTPDLFASIAELCGFMNWINAIPTNTIVDSRSFLPIIKNQGSNNRTWIFSEKFTAPTVPTDGKTIRNQDYHLLRFNNGTEELYNQTLDTQENNNLLLGTMTATDIYNYHFLCDSLNALIGSGTCQPISVPERTQPLGFHIYPNPFTHKIFIENQMYAIRIQLKNILGELIWEGENIEQENFSFLSEGVYFLLIETLKGKQNLKMIKN
ncbi:MAG: sulfatase-like hydrolase/transferase [Sphingobacteriaceae bacterium]|nr:sulfatase-like hydrolase/transferase [Sphingobacteriaceae bacterium]